MPKSPHQESKKDETLAKAGAAVETVAKPKPAKRKEYSAAEKLRIVREAEACRGERGAIEALLRREGIYSSLLTNWRQHVVDHFGARGDDEVARSQGSA